MLVHKHIWLVLLVSGLVSGCHSQPTNYDELKEGHFTLNDFVRGDETLRQATIRIDVYRGFEENESAVRDLLRYPNIEMLNILNRDFAVDFPFDSAVNLHRVDLMELRVQRSLAAMIRNESITEININSAVSIKHLPPEICNRSTPLSISILWAPNLEVSDCLVAQKHITLSYGRDWDGIADTDLPTRGRGLSVSSKQFCADSTRYRFVWDAAHPALQRSLDSFPYLTQVEFKGGARIPEGFDFSSAASLQYVTFSRPISGRELKQIATIPNLKGLSLMNGFENRNLPLPLSLLNHPSLSTLRIRRGIILPDSAFNSQLSTLLLEETSSLGEVWRFSKLQNLIVKRSIIEDVPPEIGQLETLRYLSFTGTYLSAELPEEFGRLEQLEELEFVYGRGEVQFPSSIADMKALRYFRAGGCTIKEFPNFQSASKMESFHIDGTETPIVGNCLHNWPRLKSLTIGSAHIDLSSTLFDTCDSLLFLVVISPSGFFPESVTHLPSLQRLSVIGPVLTTDELEQIHAMPSLVVFSTDNRSYDSRRRQWLEYRASLGLPTLHRGTSRGLPLTPISIKSDSRIAAERILEKYL